MFCIKTQSSFLSNPGLAATTDKTELLPFASKQNGSKDLTISCMMKLSMQFRVRITFPVCSRPARAMMKAQEGAGSLLLFITPFLLPQTFASELSVVTCGSVVKLLNIKHNVRLHSHDVRYGSGSGQQSVTGVTAADDGNSYWRIRGKTSTVCERGTLVKCGQSIRLTHVNTGRNLHSHHFTSPLSGNQEVSAFGDDGEGDFLDDWTVICNGDYWQRDEEVRFKHVSTNVLLSVTGEQYGRPINGQREVHGMTYASQHNYWKVMEGIFMKPSESPRTDYLHSEL